MASVSFGDGRAVAERSNVERTRGDGVNLAGRER